MAGATFVLAFTLAGCSGTAAPTTTNGAAGQEITIPTSSWEPGDPANLARAEGVLTVTTNHCLYLRNSPGELVAGGIIWPAGYTARDVNGRIEVARPDGVVVAKTGQTLVVGGGFGGSASNVCNGIGAGPNEAFYVNVELPPLG